MAKKELYSKSICGPAQVQAEILKNLNEGVYLIRIADGIIVFTNPKFEQMFGYDHDEMIGKKVAIVNAPTDKKPEETVREIMEVIYKTGEWHGEVKNIKKDGTTFWCYANVSVINHSEFGKVLISVHTDITDRKLAEEKIRDSEQKYAMIFRFNLACTVLTNFSNGKFSDVNEAFLSATGYEKDDLIGKTSLEVNLWVKPEDRALIIQDLSKQSRSRRIETKWRKKTGELFDVAVEAYVLFLGAEKYMLGMAQDITLQKKATEELRESEEKFKNAFNNSLLGMALVSLEGKWLQVNPAICQMLGYTEKEMLAKSFLDITHPEEAERDLKAFKKMLSGELSKYSIEKRYIHKNGKPVWVAIHATLVNDKNNQPLYVVTEVENIELRRKGEVELQEKAFELEKINKFMIGRELKMVELKNEIERLKKLK